MLAVDLIRNIMDQMGWGKPGGASDSLVSAADTDTLRTVKATNAVLKTMQLDSNWPELRETAHIRVGGAGELSGTCTVTYGNDTVTNVAFVGYALYVGQLVQFSSQDTTYRITNSGTGTWTLDREYSGTSSTSATVKVGNDRYSLPVDFDRISSQEMLNTVAGTTVAEKDPLEFRMIKRDLGTSMVIADPQNFCIKGKDSSGNMYVYFDRLAEVTADLEYEYQKKHPDIIVTSGADDVEVEYPDSVMLSIQDMVVARLNRDAENAIMTQQTMSDSIREKQNARKNPPSGSEKQQYHPQRPLRGWYRRR
jgi:hypothetical protein